MVETRYYYDAVGRLETAELPDGTTQHFIYDARGNRIEMAELRDGCIRVTTYVYDLNNRLLYSESDTESCYYEYDACGNQTLRIVSSGGAAWETKFVWNGAGQLAYSVDENGVASSYAYGPDGLRTSKTVGGEETRFFYENGSILLELDSGSRITAKTTRGLRLISRETLTEEYGYLLDGHGDVAALVNPAGKIVLDYAYDPFGNEATYQPDETAQRNNPFRYCGEYWDAETQTYYLRARQYDPATGRFLSEDTHWNPGNMTADRLSILQSSNLYPYCIGNPIQFADREGNWIESVFDFLSFLDSARAMYQDPSTVNFAFLIWDTGALILPVATGSYTVKALGTIDNLDDVGDTTKTVGKAIKEVLSEIPSSRTLRNNMVAEGIKEPLYSHAAHHIVAGYSKYAQEARRVLNKFEVGINHYANGVFLPTVKGVFDAAYHPSLHTKDYYKKVNDLLSDADSQEDVISILKTIAEQLSNGAF